MTSQLDRTLEKEQSLLGSMNENITQLLYVFSSMAAPIWSMFSVNSRLVMYYRNLICEKNSFIQWWLFSKNTANIVKVTTHQRILCFCEILHLKQKCCHHTTNKLVISFGCHCNDRPPLSIHWSDAKCLPSYQRQSQWLYEKEQHVPPHHDHHLDDEWVVGGAVPQTTAITGCGGGTWHDSLHSRGRKIRDGR